MQEEHTGKARGGGGGGGGSLEGWKLRGKAVAGERVTVCRKVNVAG